MLSQYEEYKFQARVNKALEKVKRILDNTRIPQYPADVHHEYEDKYILSEFLANSTIAALLNNFEYLGVSAKPFSQLKEWAKTKNVTLRLKAEEECKFVKKVSRDVESDTKHVTKAGILGKFESYTVKKVTEYFWNYTVKWELVAFVGVEADKGIVLQSRTGTTELKTSVETTPKPEVVVRPPVDVNITWLLQHTDDNRTPVFSINRTSKQCRTPRRNPEVESTLSFLTNLHGWAQKVHTYFIDVFNQQASHGFDLSAIVSESIFNPVLPLFESSPSSSSNSNDSTKIPPVYINSFLAEQVRSLEEKKKELEKIFTANTGLITLVEAVLLTTLLHSKQVAEAYSEGVDYIENLLYKQLAAAIGKTLTPTDFSNYMTFHYRKIYKSDFRPQAFSYAIRRPDHYPEGVLSLEAQLSGENLSNPVSTVVSSSPATRPMRFPINAATNISFLGDRHLHGYVSHQFSGVAGTNLSLYARARQFSSFILLVGRIVSADIFDPKHAIIIQNKDELKIPLLLETIPTPKEFKDAIASLSPEQQRFCKAFRSMQLESTLFGVCIIQIKPQLEKLLKLPNDSLTKEIKLSQDLLSMFIKYQIPSDLVSYDGPEESSKEQKIGKVKEYVTRMEAMLDASKQSELQQAQQQQQMRLAQPRFDAPPPPPPVMSAPMMSGPPPNPPAPGGRMMMMDTMSLSSATLSRSTSAPRRSAAPPPAPAPVPVPISVPIQPQVPRSEPAKAESVRAEPVRAEPSKPQQKEQQWKEEPTSTQGGGALSTVDYTKIPTQLEERFDKFDENNALRPTIINIGETWSKTFQKSLLSEPENTQVYSSEQEKEKNKAFDLLDALTKSGALTVDYASLHVVIASTHCFDKSIVRTVVEDNVNPIEKLENSSLIVASTIHQVEAAALISPEHLDRIKTTTAPLLLENSNRIEG